MTVLRKWFRLGRRQADALAPFRVEPTEEERIAFAIEKAELDEIHALRAISHTIYGHTNVLSGLGSTLRALEVKGEMRCECLPGMPGEGGRYRYTPTAAGLRRLAALDGE